MLIRTANLEDAPGIGRVHVDVWNETYRGIMPDRVLDGMSAEERAEAWRQRISGVGENGLFSVLVAVQGETTVGFSACGLQRSDDMRQLGFSAEFLVINLVRSAQGQGLGRQMMAQMAHTIRTRGHEAASLWAVRDNPVARGFYEHLGGNKVGEKVDVRLDLDLPEIAYGWLDLGILTARV